MAERPSHLRRPSAQRIHSLPNDALSLSLPASPYARTASTASTTPTLLRLPSTRSPQGRRATNPSSPLTPANADTSSTASPASSSYFGIQPTSAVPARSPGSKKPPAFFSGHGVDASQGPPNSLVTRGNVDIARRAPKPVDPDAVTPAKPVLVSPGPVVQIGASSPAETPSFSRRSSTQTVQQEPPMERSLNGSVGLRSVRSVSAEPEPKTTNWSFSSSEANGDEDLFIAAANAGRPHGVEAPSRAERLRVGYVMC
ncbi:hypothetical protein M011DRAFT_73963 [Sporormia fimetaria CBS 119925]|uniref:Uncharacterized protein n=1 Tax=Sporormia fimetaria CBS 119925 TaxID=1340428 RepID=A0A6A6V7K2_9PLEO|nr:hypothetical protein M011DRAFT_73963 [Sporormia fimetaria CBS 119925]